MWRGRSFSLWASLPFRGAKVTLLIPPWAPRLPRCRSCIFHVRPEPLTSEIIQRQTSPPPQPHQMETSPPIMCASIRPDIETFPPIIQQVHGYRTSPRWVLWVPWKMQLLFCHKLATPPISLYQGYSTRKLKGPLTHCPVFLGSIATPDPQQVKAISWFVYFLYNLYFLIAC